MCIYTYFSLKINYIQAKACSFFYVQYVQAAARGKVGAFNIRVFSDQPSYSQKVNGQLFDFSLMLLLDPQLNTDQ